MVAGYRRCHRCGFPLTALDRFCGACGYEASRLCPRCEHQVPNDLPFCNYCGQPLAPVPETVEPLPRAERASMLYEKEIEAFEAKVGELRARLRYMRKRSLRKRGFELGFFIILLLVVVIWGAPFIDTQWREIFARSPGRSIVISFFSSVLLVLIIGYILQVRQFQDNSDMEELRARLLLARERLEEARERIQEWTRSTSPEQGNREPESGPVKEGNA